MSWRSLVRVPAQVLAVAAVIGLLSAAAGVAGWWGGRARGAEAGPGGPGARVISISARAFSYTPGIITVRQGERVTLRLSAQDSEHGFYLDGYGVQAAVLPGQTRRVSFVADRPGRFMFRCSVTCGPFHPYMVGWLRVEPNRPFNTGVALAALVAVAAIGLAWTVGVRR